MAGTAHLRKFSTTFYKDKVAGVDLAQIPAGSATVNVYRQGATVATGTTVTTAVGGVAVAVRSVGHVLLNDTVQLGTDATKQMLVEEVTSDTSIKLRSTTGSSIVVSAGDRLVIYGPTTPSLFTESSGVGTLANPTTTSSVGYVEFYTPEARFDIIVSGTGLTTTLYKDGDSGWVKGGSTWINAKDYSTLQAAVDALSSTAYRGTCFIPAGLYNSSSTPSFTGLTLPAGCTLQGEGYATTVLDLIGGSTSTHLVSLPYTDAHVRDISLKGPGSAGSGCGIRAYTAGLQVSSIHISDCAIFDTASYGISLTADSGQFVDQIHLTNVNVYNALSGGSMLLGATGAGANIVMCEKCNFNGPSFGTYGAGSVSKGAVHIVEGNNITFDACGFQPSSAAGAETAISILGISRNIKADGCHFETNLTVGNHWITTSGGNTHIIFDNCYFYRSTAAAIGARILKTDAGGLLSGVFQNCMFHHKDTGSSTDDIVSGDSTDAILIVNCDHHHNITGTRRQIAFSPVRAGTGYIQSQWNAWQFKIPSVTSTATITTPENGGIIFETTNNKLWCYENATWRFPMMLGAPPTAADLDATPSVKGLSALKLSNSGATTITQLDDGVAGQIVVLLITNSNTTIADSGNFKLSTAAPATADDTLTLIYDGTSWIEIARSAN